MSTDPDSSAFVARRIRATMAPGQVMNKFCVFLSLLMVMCATYADIYKWIDRQGNVHFSDTPHPGAEKLNSPDAQSVPTSSPHLVGPKRELSNHTYAKVAIVQPDNEATIRNNQGFIEVTVQIKPALFPGDKLQMIFDGTSLGEPQVNPHFQLSGIFRGSHIIAVQIIDASGHVLDNSDTITVYLFRPRVGMGTSGGGTK